MRPYLYRPAFVSYYRWQHLLRNMRLRPEETMRLLWKFRHWSVYTRQRVIKFLKS